MSNISGSGGERGKGVGTRTHDGKKERAGREGEENSEKDQD